MTDFKNLFKIIFKRFGIWILLLSLLIAAMNGVQTKYRLANDSIQLKKAVNEMSKDTGIKINNDRKISKDYIKEADKIALINSIEPTAMIIRPTWPTKFPAIIPVATLIMLVPNINNSDFNIVFPKLPIFNNGERSEAEIINIFIIRFIKNIPRPIINTIMAFIQTSSLFFHGSIKLNS